jgi:hypothetical protein
MNIGHTIERYLVYVLLVVAGMGIIPAAQYLGWGVRPLYSIPGDIAVYPQEPVVQAETKGRGKQ